MSHTFNQFKDINDKVPDCVNYADCGIELLNLDSLKEDRYWRMSSIKTTSDYNDNDIKNWLGNYLVV